MERPQLSSEIAEAVVNLLRDNPGVSMTLDQISEELNLPVEDLAAYLDELVGHKLVVQDTTPDGFDTFAFPAEYQRGTQAP